MSNTSKGSFEFDAHVFQIMADFGPDLVRWAPWLALAAGIGPAQAAGDNRLRQVFAAGHFDAPDDPAGELAVVHIPQNNMFIRCCLDHQGFGLLSQILFKGALAPDFRRINFVQANPYLYGLAEPNAGTNIQRVAVTDSQDFGGNGR